MSLPQGERQSWIQLDIKDDFVISTKQNLVYLCLTSIMQNAIQALQNYTQKPLIQIQLIDSKAPTLMLGHSIRISDNGPGSPPAVLTRILTSRPTASNEIVAGGSGMGLIFCKKIMLSLNGNISVNSTKAGTSVTLHFPYSKKD
jgi:two-component system response regulator PhcR